MSYRKEEYLLINTYKYGVSLAKVVVTTPERVKIGPNIVDYILRLNQDVAKEQGQKNLLV